MTNLETAIHNLKSFEADLERHINSDSDMTAQEWDKMLQLLQSRVESTEADIERMKIYKKKGIFFDVWA